MAVSKEYSQSRFLITPSFSTNLRTFLGINPSGEYAQYPDLEQNLFDLVPAVLLRPPSPIRVPLKCAPFLRQLGQV